MNHPVLQPYYLASYPFRPFTGLLGELMRCLTIGGIPAEIAGIQLIAFVSLLTQGIADILWPNGLRAPIGVPTLLVAPSGTGKTLTRRILIELIEQYLAERSKGNSTTAYVDFLLEDVTREALVQSLKGWPIAGLFTDEAGQLKRLLKDASTLAKLLDGSPLRSARASTGRVELWGQRFTMLLMEQPEVFEATKILLGASKGSVGLINRFYIAPFNGVASNGSLQQVELTASVKKAYEKKIHELLDATIQYVEKQTGERPTLRLSVEATQYLLSLGDDVRKNCQPGSPWFFISEYISRHVERVLRLAGAFHVFEYGIEGEVSVDTIQRAATLGQWHIEAFAQMVYEPPKLTQTETDAIGLERAICQVFHTAGISMFRQSEMRTYALNLGLTPTRFTRALAALGGQGKVRVVMQRNTPWIEFNAFHVPQYR